MPVTPRYKSTAPKIPSATSVSLKSGEPEPAKNSRESVMQAAKARASKPKKSKKRK